MSHIAAYLPGHRRGVLDLWNRAFRALRNFRPLGSSEWRARVEGLSIPGGADTLTGSGPAHFDPRFFRVALDGDAVIGFVHGGIWEDEFLARLLPGGRRARVGTLLIIAVDPDHRRRGIGAALLDDLSRTLEEVEGVTGPLRADGRGYNPFYGNFLAPLPPPWGTPEGIALPATDAGARAFFRSTGFREETEAISRVRTLTDRPRFERTVPEGVVVEEVENWQPILGTDDGTPFPLANDSRTWLLREGDHQRGALVAFPLGEDGARWGIHSFEVESERRGEGLGRLLLEYVIASLARRGVRDLETLALPEEASEADRLYDRLGFAAEDRWIVLA